MPKYTYCALNPGVKDYLIWGKLSTCEDGMRVISCKIQGKKRLNYKSTEPVKASVSIKC